MNDGTLNWLQQFYGKQCDGEWEHSYGISIENTDNPGWTVRVDLHETALENKKMERIDRHRSDTDWVICQVKDKTFIGGAGVMNLIELLSIFREWVEKENLGSG